MDLNLLHVPYMSAPPGSVWLQVFVELKGFLYPPASSLFTAYAMLSFLLGHSGAAVSRMTNRLSDGKYKGCSPLAWVVKYDDLFVQSIMNVVLAPMGMGVVEGPKSRIPFARLPV